MLVFAWDAFGFYLLDFWRGKYRQSLFHLTKWGRMQRVFLRTQDFLLHYTVNSDSSLLSIVRLLRLRQLTSKNLNHTVGYSRSHRVARHQSTTYFACNQYKTQSLLRKQIVIYFVQNKKTKVSNGAALVFEWCFSLLVWKYGLNFLFETTWWSFMRFIFVMCLDDDDSFFIDQKRFEI